ncbi:hypothetical protein AYJ54_12705 [Bradyrhizobium centrolobii]|uniref:Uncharacterized protein n=2 Tax=Bradyrhizobium centrolobii TaxID=1505087 RepID=A0A176YQY9_9BRAD|nr:hypothetical protein AYJ54_12705 [Bradyrhizobium centrolobii]
MLSSYRTADAPMPASGRLFCAAGALVQFWLHSRIELRDAVEIGGADMPDDDQFIESTMKLIGGAR